MHVFSRLRKHTQERETVELGDVLLDSANLPAYEKERGEGRAVVPLPERSYRLLTVLASLILLLLLVRVGVLSLLDGETYRARAEANRLDAIPVFAERGSILDRNGVPLAWNVLPPEQEKTENTFSTRAFIDRAGYGHILGFVSLPKKDTSGVFYRNTIEGKAGTEGTLDALLRGTHGKKLIEVDAKGAVRSESVFEPPQSGAEVTLSIDTRVEDILFNAMQAHIEKIPFIGGAAAIMDVTNGELIAYTSYPEFSPQAITDGDSDALTRYHNDARAPFLDRMARGLYAPGSIVKPFVALEALSLGIISPEKEIYSAGSISVPNPYNPDRPTVFRDWRAHGATDMRHAIAVSSDVYFYAIGGGIPGQRGMGITGIERALSRFGFGTEAPFLFGSEAGVLPNPEWKAKTFEDGVWRLGDTYTSAIGQFGTLVTPLHALRAVAALANGGVLLEPVMVRGKVGTQSHVPDLKEEDLVVVREGMRLATEPGNTAAALKLRFTSVAAKTGTAEVGLDKALVNSWVIGFWPEEKPRYAFVMVLEKGPIANLFGAPGVMRKVLEEMHEKVPEYFE